MDLILTDKDIARFESKFIKGDLDDCWEWQKGLDGSGYGMFCCKGKDRRAHRVAYCTANNIELDSENLLLHSCDNRLCVNPNHLRVGTNKDNVDDRVSKGRSYQPKGVLNPKAKLTEDDIVSIRLRLEDGENQYSLAKDFKVHQTTISKINLCKYWSHV